MEHMRCVFSILIRTKLLLQMHTCTRYSLAHTNLSGITVEDVGDLTHWQSRRRLQHHVYLSG
jgi:hypothetical protein